MLGVGGILGEAWLTGFLAGAETATGVDFREARMFIGTSAGSIVAASLAAGVPPRRPRDASIPPDRAAGERNGIGEARGRACRRSVDEAYPLAAPAVHATATAWARARATLIASLPAGTRSLEGLRASIGALKSAFDPRLRIVAVDRATGRRVIFGADGAPTTTVADAVAASCAIPGYFAPIRIAGREYVDGGVWSPTNLDVATIRCGDRVLCLVPTGALTTSGPPVLRAAAAALHLSTGVEAAAARRQGATVTIVTPDADASAAIGTNPLDPQPANRVLAEGFRQGAATQI